MLRHGSKIAPGCESPAGDWPAARALHGESRVERAKHVLQLRHAHLLQARFVVCDARAVAGGARGAERKVADHDHVEVAFVVESGVAPRVRCFAPCQHVEGKVESRVHVGLGQNLLVARDGSKQLQLAEDVGGVARHLALRAGQFQHGGGVGGEAHRAYANVAGVDLMREPTHGAFHKVDDAAVARGSAAELGVVD